MKGALEILVIFNSLLSDFKSINGLSRLNFGWCFGSE